MMLLTLAFDTAQVDAEEIGEIEERVWNALKLSGEYNRTLKENRWIVQYVIEKKIREDAVHKISGVEKAVSFQLRDYAEDNGRGKRKTALVTGDMEDEDQESDEADNEED